MAANPTLTIAEREKVITFLSTLPSFEICKECGKSAGYELLKTSQIFRSQDTSDNIAFGYPPLIAIACKHCGHIRHFKSERLGIFP